MYDFHFGTHAHIEENPQSWLIDIKRMLPRWPNGIPDSEFLAVYDLLSGLEEMLPADDRRNSVLVETGSGASSIVLLYFAIRWDCQLFTWDISSTKLAYLRGMLTDTLFKYYSDKNIFQHWKYVAGDSKSQYVGIPIIHELNKQISFCFLDSEHTWANLEAEVSHITPVMMDGGIVSIDDANYEYSQHNTAYINMLRNKVGLSSVQIADNRCAPFHEQVANHLSENFSSVMPLDGGSYRTTYKDDIFWRYYEGDRKSMAELDMEKMDKLALRFEAWKVFR